MKDKAAETVVSEAITVRPEPAEHTEVLILEKVMDLDSARRRLAEFQEFVKGYLVEKEDYGNIPGVKQKVLFKSGADKLCELYGLADKPIIIQQTENYEAGLFDYTVMCPLYRGERLVATGMGSCNSYEGKYRWRDAQRLCPVCQKPAIIKGKAEYGGGWLCWTKKDGCGAKFADGDARIEGQPAGRVQNDDAATLKNTILKMAKKRAKIDATLAATRSSGIFTQDLEEQEPPPPEPPQQKRDRGPAITMPEAVDLIEPSEEITEQPTAPAEQPTAPAQAPAGITAAQAKQLWRDAKTLGWTEKEISAELKRRYPQSKSTREIPAADLVELRRVFLSGTTQN